MLLYKTVLVEAFTVLSTFERQKKNSSVSNVLPSTQHGDRFTGTTLLPAVAVFDKKPLDAYST